MTCELCRGDITATDQINYHHPEYKSNGGKRVVPSHKICHVELHRSRGDFREWGRLGGKLSALDKHWAFTLRGVKDDPLYEQARAFNRAAYSKTN